MSVPLIFLIRDDPGSYLLATLSGGIITLLSGGLVTPSKICCCDLFDEDNTFCQRIAGSLRVSQTSCLNIFAVIFYLGLAVDNLPIISAVSDKKW